MWEAAVKKVFATGNRETIEFLYQTPGGKRYYNTRLVPEFAPDGTVQTVLAIGRDITEQHQVDEIRESVISMVSHELRTPLTNIKGYSSSLLQSTVTWDEATRQDFIQTIDREADRMTRLIEDILDMSRLQRGRVPLRRSAVSPDTLARSALTQASPFLEEHNVSLHIPPGLPLVSADPERIEQVIINLLQNAAKYSPEGSSIRLEAAGGGNVVFSVVDSGIGIAPEYHEAIFQMFSRIPTPGYTQVSGTGLGLAMCKAIVEAHGGRIWVESKPGQGAAFRFTIPLES
jgi:signal transduction histidine kinase